MDYRKTIGYLLQNFVFCSKDSSAEKKTLMSKAIKAIAPQHTIKKSVVQYFYETPKA